MKNTFLGLGLTALLAVSCGTNNAQLQGLEAKKEVLKLNTKLNDLKIKREKQYQEVAKLRSKANKINSKADNRTNRFSSEDHNAVSTAKDAAKTAALLKDTQKANQNLAKGQEKLNKLDKEIQKVQTKLDRLNKEIEFVDKAK